MAKRKNKKSNKKPAVKKQTERITLEAINAMSDSDDGEDIPEAQWNTKAKSLKQAIVDGKFDSLLEQMKETAGDDEMEEATLDSKSDSEEVVPDKKSGAKKRGGKKAAIEEGSASPSNDDNDKEASDSDDDKEKEEEEKDVEQEKQVDEKEPEQEDNDSENSASDKEEEEEDDDRPDEEDEKMKRLKANNHNNSKALSVVTAGLAAAHAKLPWAETFDIIPKTPLPFGDNGDPESNPLDVHDDLKREVAFYNMALEAVHCARKECKKAKITFSRPDDFFAEMIKTDDHMAKVKDRLIFENKKMEAVAQRKSNKEQKLRAKESHANKVAEKSKRKRDHFQQVEEWANSVAKNRGSALQDDADEVFLKNRQPGRKRQNADEKYGHGGKRGRFKQNDRSTLNDQSGFNPRGNFAGGMKISGKGKGGAGADRKGKRARDAGRNRRS